MTLKSAALAVFSSAVAILLPAGCTVGLYLLAAKAGAQEPLPETPPQGTYYVLGAAACGAMAGTHQELRSEEDVMQIAVFCFNKPEQLQEMGQYIYEHIKRQQQDTPAGGLGG